MELSKCAILLHNNKDSLLRLLQFTMLFRSWRKRDSMPDLAIKYF